MVAWAPVIWEFCNFVMRMRRFSWPPRSSMRWSMLFKYCYWGPRIDPGLAILIQPMKAAGGKPKCFIQYKPIKVPVRPSPALQWTARAPFSFSAAVKNYGTISSGGAVPSWNWRSRSLIPCLINFYFSYCALLRRTTIVTPSLLNIGT